MKIKHPTVYAFIDSQNLNLGTSVDIKRNGKLIYKGWKLDFKKFYIYLKDKFRVSKALLFIGYIKENNSLYKKLRDFGYELIFKPTVNDSSGKPKGNVDAELVLHCAAVKFTNYDKAVIVSGDGDFYCLLEYLEKKNKLQSLIIPNRYSESSLLRKFQDSKVVLNREEDNLRFEPTKMGGVAHRHVV